MFSEKQNICCSRYDSCICGICSFMDYFFYGGGRIRWNGGFSDTVRSIDREGKGSACAAAGGLQLLHLPVAFRSKQFVFF